MSGQTVGTFVTPSHLELGGHAPKVGRVSLSDIALGILLTQAAAADLTALQLRPICALHARRVRLYSCSCPVQSELDGKDVVVMVEAGLKTKEDIREWLTLGRPSSGCLKSTSWSRLCWRFVLSLRAHCLSLSSRIKLCVQRWSHCQASVTCLL